MSRHDWESGTLKLPTAAWAKFKKDLREGFNVEQRRLLDHATRLHTQMLAAGKGQRAFNYADCLQKLNYPADDRNRYSQGWKPDDRQIERLDTILIDTKTKKLRRPLAKDFPLANGKTMTFTAGYEGHIALSDENRSVHWSVPENNHAVEAAHNTQMACVCFGLLAKVTWTRGTGGTIAGNDEYNRDSRDSGGGSNYVTKRFGPLGKEDFSFLRGSRKTRAVR